MGRPTLNDLKLFIDDLFTNRKEVLLSANCGVTYEKRLRESQGSILALPGYAERARPLAEELDDADGVFDDFGRFIWHMGEAYRFLPGLSSGLRKEIAAIQKAFIPSLDELTEPYPDEAAKAKDRRPSLEEHGASLKKFPVAEKGSLLDVATSFLDSGDNIGKLLGDRAVVTQEGESKGDRREAGRLRNTTLGLIRRFRETLADELAVRPELARDLDGKIFGYFDLLVQIRANGSTEPTPPPVKTSAPKE